MGQGNGGDRPGRGGDRDGARRGTDDDVADEAKRKVQQALDEARNARAPDEYESGGGDVARADDTGSIDPDTIRKDFGVDPTETSTRRSADTGSSFQTLTPEQRTQLKTSLTEEHGEEAVESVYSQLENWKKGSGDMSVSQPYERLARDALGIESNVRGGGTQATEPTNDERGVYRDLNRVSRAFLKANKEYGERFRVHRGVRTLNASTLAAQAIDEPNREQFYFPTSTISNHTTLETDSREYSDGVMVSWEAELDDVAMAIDHVFDTPRTEGELHIKGGVFTVTPDGMMQEPATSDNRTVVETVSLMESPASLSLEEHHDVSNLVTTVAASGVQLRTEAGRTRARKWADEYLSVTGISDQRKRVVQKSIQTIVAGSSESKW